MRHRGACGDGGGDGSGQRGGGVALAQTQRRGARIWASGTAQVDDAGRWTRPWGLLRPADEIAMLGRRYMHEFGATRDCFAAVALALRKHANRNPHAAMYQRPLTYDEYMSARWVSEPLCLFDCCLETDGALAAVIVRSDRARDCRQPPVYVHALAQGLPAQHQADDQLFLRRPAPLPVVGMRQAALARFGIHSRPTSKWPRFTTPSVR